MTLCCSYLFFRHEGDADDRPLLDASFLGIQKTRQPSLKKPRRNRAAENSEKMDDGLSENVSVTDDIMNQSEHFINPDDQ